MYHRIAALTAKTKYQHLLKIAEEMAAMDPFNREHFNDLRRRASQALKMKNVANPNLKEARAVALKTTKARGAATRARVMPYIKTFTAQGPQSFEALAVALNASNVPSPRGGKWSKMAVKRILDQET